MLALWRPHRFALSLRQEAGFWTKKMKLMNYWWENMQQWDEPSVLSMHKENMLPCVFSTTFPMFPSPGLPRIPAWQLHKRRGRLPLCSPDGGRHGGQQRELGHRVHGLHQRALQPRQVQILPSAGSPASQDKGGTAPGHSKHSVCSLGESQCWQPILDFSFF